MRQLELALDPVREAINRVDAPKLVKALLLAVHGRGGRIADLNRYYATFHPDDVPLIKRTVCGAIRRGLLAPEGRGVRLTLSEETT